MRAASSGPGPPRPGSAAFARDYEEIKSLGARHSSTRSADQTAAAIFWTVQTAVPWHAAARAVSAAKGLSISENARLFAVLSMATADSQIIAFAEKYRRPHWRRSRRFAPVSPPTRRQRCPAMRTGSR